MRTGHRPQETAEHQLIYGCDAEHQSLQEGIVNRAPAWAHEQVCSVCRSKKRWERLQSRSIKMTRWPIREASGEKINRNWILDEDTYLRGKTSCRCSEGSQGRQISKYSVISTQAEFHRGKGRERTSLWDGVMSFFLIHSSQQFLELKQDVSKSNYYAVHPETYTVLYVNYILVTLGQKQS